MVNFGRVLFFAMLQKIKLEIVHSIVQGAWSVRGFWVCVRREGWGGGDIY